MNILKPKKKNSKTERGQGRKTEGRNEGMNAGRIPFKLISYKLLLPGPPAGPAPPPPPFPAPPLSNDLMDSSFWYNGEAISIPVNSPSLKGAVSW